MRLVLPAAALVGAIALLAPGAAIARAPVVVYVGSPHDGSVVYGPGDMLCDLHLCRLFAVPQTPLTPKGVIVEFGIPQPSGQGRIDIRRCLQVCRASVLGFASERTSKQTSPGPAVFITPVEMRLD